MPVRTNDIKKGAHTHQWGPAYNLDERRCNCGKMLISVAESERRTEEWNSYLELVRGTDSYREWKDWTVESVNQAQDRLTKNDYLLKPSFADPVGEAWRYQIGEV